MLREIDSLDSDDSVLLETSDSVLVGKKEVSVVVRRSEEDTLDSVVSGCDEVSVSVTELRSEELNSLVILVDVTL